MAKYYGAIGFALGTEETRPGVYEEKMVERFYYGEITRNYRRLVSTSSSVNDDISISNNISVIADPFANENFHSIRYVTFMNSKWKVTDVEVEFPRLILTLGGLYNA